MLDAYRRLRPEGRADGVQRRPHAVEAVRELCSAHDASTGCASASCANTCGRTLLTKADEESIDLVERAIADLRTLGATIVDPGAEGALFTRCITRYAPELLNSAFARQYPQLFPVGCRRQPTAIRSRRCSQLQRGPVARARRS